MAYVKSDASHARLDLSRLQKAQKIVAILSDFVSLKNCSILDIGTGSGHIISLISAHCKKATSVDLHDERMEKKGYTFKKVGDEKLPFPDDSFDVVISNHVLEHVPNQELHLSEIHRVLRKGGFLYLATPNKWWIMDPHYKLPFITYLPRRIARAYLSITKNKEEWDIYSLSYWNAKKMLRERFTTYNILPRLVKSPGKYHVEVYRPLQPILRRFPSTLIRGATPLSPTFVIMAQKK